MIDENKREIELSDELMKAITNFQDCVHNTAIEYHRKVRSKEVTKSLLDNIDGIGEVRKTELLKRFGSVEKILNASDDEISQINGINKKWLKDKGRIRKNVINLYTNIYINNSLQEYILTRGDYLWSMLKILYTI